MLLQILDCLQLWSDQTTQWNDISSLNVSKWALQTSSNELVPVDMEEYLFPANRAPFTELMDSRLVPYARNEETQQDELASLPTALQRSGVFAITASVSAVPPGNLAFACPVSGATFGNGVKKVLYMGDSFTVSFSSTVAPARVKICGRYQPQPIVTDGIDGQYTFTHTVQAGDDDGACSLMVYLPWRWGTLPVYEQATGFSVGKVCSSERCLFCNSGDVALKVARWLLTRTELLFSVQILLSYPSRSHRQSLTVRLVL